MANEPTPRGRVIDARRLVTGERGRGDDERRLVSVRYIVAVAALLAVTAILLQLMRLHVDAAAYEQQRLTTTQADLQDRIGVLKLDLQSRDTSQYLSGEAAKLGMVPAPAPAFLEVGTSTVIGTPKAAESVDPESLSQLGDASVDSSDSPSAGATPDAPGDAGSATAPASGAAEASATPSPQAQPSASEQPAQAPTTGGPSAPAAEATPGNVASSGNAQ
ncbi:hypothetical protein JT358_02435 [Micrococcales bacterium 31B]|nr:hypothetical protein [Micrococcales bacterium 31B]